MKCVAGVIKNEKGEILLQNHVKTDGWTLPGGKLDDGEDYKLGLVRELYEELGILAYRYRVIHMDFIEDVEYPAHSGSNTNFDFWIYDIQEYKGTIENKEPKKHLELRYVKLEDIRNLGTISAVLDSYLKLHYL